MERMNGGSEVEELVCGHAYHRECRDRYLEVAGKRREEGLGRGSKPSPRQFCQQGLQVILSFEVLVEAALVGKPAVGSVVV